MADSHKRNAVVRVVALIAAVWGMALSGSVAWAAGGAAPSGLTAAATSVRTTSVTLSGTANSRSTVTLNFRYGTTTSYGNSTAPLQYGAGQSIATHADIVGLTPGTTYHFQLVATNQDGTSTTTDQTFTTSRTPSVTTGGASALHAGVVTVAGTANPNGYATTVNFQYGLTTAYGGHTAGKSIGSGTSNVAFHGDLTSLLPGKTYHYRAVATNQNGTTYGNDRTTTPAAVASVITGDATSVQAISATLGATVNPGGSSTIVIFQYGTSPSYGSISSAKTLSGSAPITFHLGITNLTPGTTYHYRAVGTNSAGAIYGSDKTFTTTKKPVLTTGAAISVGDTTATLTGTVDPSGSTTTVNFEYGADTTYGSLTSAQKIGGGIDPVSYQADITGLQPGTTYHFRAIGTSGSGSAQGKDVTFTTTGTAPSSSASADSSPAATPTTGTGTSHPKPSGFDPLLLVGAIALGVLIVGGIGVVALARGRN